jgi:hypothetical protein
MAFCWQGERQNIHQVIASWRTPQAKWFRVLGEEGQIYDLCYTYTLDAWSVIQC